MLDLFTAILANTMAAEASCPTLFFQRNFCKNQDNLGMCNIGQ